MFGPETRAEAEKFNYGRSYSPEAYDPTRCAAQVSERNGNWTRAHQCLRKPGFGPDGIFCKQHDPEAAKARDDAREAKWRAERARDTARRKLEGAAQDMLAIIRKIAAGDNDPRALCADFLKKFDGK